MIRPIPKRKLPNTVYYKAYSDNTGEGNTYDTEVALYNVKIEDIKKYLYNSNGREIIGNAIMFYDCKNSCGLSAEPINNSIITFKDREYHIISTETLTADSDEPHHYEVMLK